MVSISQQPTAAANKLTQTPMLIFEGHKHTIPSISYFPDSKRIFSGSYDMTTRLWDLEMGKEIEEAREVRKQEVHAVGVSRDGRWAVTAFGELEVCEVETRTVRTFKGHSHRIDRIDISKDSTLLAGAEGSTVRIWSLETGELVASLPQRDNEVGAVRFSHDSKKLAAKGCGSNYLKVWDIWTQTLDASAKAEEYGYCLAISYTPVFWTINDKTIIAAFSNHGPQNRLYELDASTLDPVCASFGGHTKIITGLALSLDCALLASASDDDIKLWAFGSRQLLASFDVMYAHHLILSPDSRQLVYTTLLNDIHVCNTGILTSIPPEPQNNALRSLPLVDSGTHTLTGNPSTSKVPLDALLSIPSHSLPPPPLSFAHRAGFEPWTDRHAGTSRIHIRTLPPLPSSAVDSRLLQPRDLPPEGTPQDLSKYITKDGDYPVARGGFGEIWKCTFHIDRRLVQVHFQSCSFISPKLTIRQVAVKALQVYADDQLGAAKTKKTKRIMRELRICANLKHPNILPVYGYTYGFGPFLAIVSPWAENGNLTAYLERHAALTLLRRFEILRDIIAGLRYLHANSVIHGDFNGPNVLIHGDGTACVADFGLSLMYSEVISASQASWTSTLKGNMRWMAPELLVPEREDGSPTRPSKHSDMFSFGGIMLLVLTNKIPYYYLPNDAAIVLCIAKLEKPSRSRYPELPEKYWSFIEQCWSTDPQGRPSTEGADVTIRNEFHSLSRSR